MKKLSAKSAMIAALVAKKAQENAMRGVHCMAIAQEVVFNYWEGLISLLF